ncbi:hypothetical protein CHUAL_002377 [Chamberlinius hualienensis]
MATCVDEDFENWLCSKLRALNTDPDVFSAYIRGILEGDETIEEKVDALQEILVEITAEDIPAVSMEIIRKWENFSSAVQNNDPLKFDVDARLASIMEKQAQSVVNERKVSEEDRKYREAILAQYSQVSDEDDDENCDSKEPLGATSADSAKTRTLAKNTNAEDVAKAEKEKREKAKAECEKKKATDKANKLVNFSIIR